MERMEFSLAYASPLATFLALFANMTASSESQLL